MENLTNEELLDEFDLLEKEIEDETTVTDRRLVILERQKELFAQLRINVRRRPTIQEYENLIDKLVGAAAIVQYDHLPKATLESYRLQATEAKAELLRLLGAAVPASPQPRPWFPIETAPKDGRHIQAANFSGKDCGRDIGFGSGQSYQCVVHWWQWCDGTHQEEWGWYPSTGAGESDALTTLTHWKPLEEFFSAAPAQEPRIGEPCPTCERKYLGKMGPGDYSCCVCGMGMIEPCEHWKLFEESAAQEQPVENSPHGSLKDFSVAKALEGFSKEPPQPTVFSPQKGKP